MSNPAVVLTVFPHIRPASIIFSQGLQLRVLLEITKFHLHKSVPLVQALLEMRVLFMGGNMHGGYK